MYDPQQYNADHIVPQGTTGVSFFAVMKNVYLWMTLALAITGLTAMAVATQPQMVYSIASNSLVFWGLLLAELGLVWFISARIMSLSVTTAGVLFAIYALLNGVTFSFIFLVYTASSIAQTFFITAGVQPPRWGGKGDPDLNIKKVEWLADVKDRKIRSITINARLEAVDVALVTEILELVRHSVGDSALQFNIYDASTSQWITLSSRNSRINVTHELVRYIEAHPALTYSIN